MRVGWSTHDLAAGTDKPIAKQSLVRLEQILEPNPDARLVSISVDNGGSSSGAIPVNGLSTGADNLVVGSGERFDRYDFGG